MPRLAPLLLTRVSLASGLAAADAAKAPAAKGRRQTAASTPTPAEVRASRGAHAQMDEPPPATAARPQEVAPPAEGERVAFIGTGLAERDVYYGRLETELHLRFPGQKLFVRNLGRPGDTPGFRPHPARVSQWAFPGAEQFRPELASHNGKGFFPTPDEWLTHLKADTVVAFFGFNESFDGPERAPVFEAELDAFVRHTQGRAYHGRAAPRLVLVSP
ncbi:MAG: membrane-bound dehydrogenase, partial [Verrucomicrobiota bacterium]